LIFIILLNNLGHANNKGFVSRNSMRYIANFIGKTAF
jgi:hypothetical protein